MIPPGSFLLCFRQHLYFCLMVHCNVISSFKCRVLVVLFIWILLGGEGGEGDIYRQNNFFALFTI